MADKLTDRQRAFVDEYLVDLNATAAAVRAGYSEKNAGKLGPRLLVTPKVRAAIDKRLLARQARVEVTQDRVIEELARIGFANMMDYVTVQSDGDAYVDLSKLTREQASAIAEVVVDEYTEGRGEDARDVKRVKVKLIDKRGALVDLGKHLGLFSQPQKHTVKHDGKVTHEHRAIPNTDQWLSELLGEDGEDGPPSAAVPN